MDKENTPPVFIETIDLLGNGKVIKNIITEGQQDERPKVGDEVTVHYVGTLLDGSVFDSSRSRQTPFDFVLGAGQVIKGWDVGVASMNKGEVAELILQPDFAYGKQGSPPKIPPEAVLKFEVELLRFAPKKRDKHTLTTEERMQNATECKEQANNLFKEGKYSEATHEYMAALDYLEDCTEWAEPLMQAATPLKLSVHLNLANARLKCQSWLECVLQATAALQLDRNNVKALYRRGLARIELGELMSAKADLLAAAKAEPQNAEIRKALQRCKDEVQKYDKESSAAYARMFK